MSDNNLSNGPPAAAYYFWCLDIRWGAYKQLNFLTTRLYYYLLLYAIGVMSVAALIQSQPIAIRKSPSTSVTMFAISRISLPGRARRSWIYVG